MVIIEEPFGRVEKLWHYDMGLVYYSPRFRAALRGEVNSAILVDEVVNPPLSISIKTTTMKSTWSWEKIRMEWTY